MIIVNTQEITGKKIKETLTVVKGSSVRAKWFGKDIMSALRHIVGGELKEYKELLDEARDAATERMVQEAETLGADAIVNVHFMTAAISQGAAEILVYGTAVKFK
ncbi:MAG: YbjQ family protein [Nanoarchaeales archaeon]|nr:YbjQ family protein [Nanoarchaeales archaeon]